MKKLYSIYDFKAEFYAPPFVAANREDAARQVAMALMASPTIPPAMYPEDFFLMELAEWNEVDGEISGCGPLRLSSCELILRKFVKKSETPDSKGTDNA